MPKGYARRPVPKELHPFARTGKQRSRPQQATAERLKLQTLALAHAEKAWRKASVSTTSWWLNLSREELERQAHQQAARMSASRFASGGGVE